MDATTWITCLRAESRRRIVDNEVPHLEGLGRHLRALRNAAGLSRDELALRAGMNTTTIQRIEIGARRTRRSTLLRIVRELVPTDEIELEMSRLVAIAGHTLAPKSDYGERVAGRRARREQRRLRAAAPGRERQRNKPTGVSGATGVIGVSGPSRRAR